MTTVQLNKAFKVNFDLSLHNVEDETLSCENIGHAYALLFFIIYEPPVYLTSMHTSVYSATTRALF